MGEFNGVGSPHGGFFSPPPHQGGLEILLFGHHDKMKLNGTLFTI